MNRRTFLALSAEVGAASVAGCSRDGASGYGTIDVDGVTRRYLIDLPSGYDEDSGETHPMLVALHGGTGSARGFSERNGFVRTGDREGFLVVHPDGKGLTGRRFHVWNTGYLDPRLSDANDYAFVARLVRHLVETRDVDERRVYLVGHSMGAMLTHEMAARYPELFAAVAPVAGTVGGYPCESPDRCGPYTPPEPDRPVPVVTAHGTADGHVPYDGGRPDESLRRRPRYDFSVRRTLDWWKRQNGCTGHEPETTGSPSGRIHRLAYPCGGNGGVEHLRFDGVGHFWGEFDAAVANWDGPGATLADLLWRRLRNAGPDADAPGTFHRA